MEKIKHTDVHIQYAFECPSCNWNHWLMPNQLLHSGFFIACECGNTFIPSPPSTDQVLKNDNLKEIQSLLVAQGFSKDGIAKAYAKIKKTGDLQKEIELTIENYDF